MSESRNFQSNPMTCCDIQKNRDHSLTDETKSLNKEYVNFTSRHLPRQCWLKSSVCLTRLKYSIAACKILSTSFIYVFTKRMIFRFGFVLMTQKDVLSLGICIPIQNIHKKLFFTSSKLIIQFHPTFLTVSPWILNWNRKSVLHCDSSY